MPEETGTETHRPVGAGADVSPFGDAAAELTSDAYAGHDRHEAVPREDLRVVVSLRGDWATVGVQQPESDPHIETFGGLDGPGAVREVTAVIERAKARWEDSPRHPAYQRPAPPVRGGNRGGQEELQAANTEGEQAVAQQQKLSLF